MREDTKTRARAFRAPRGHRGGGGDSRRDSRRRRFVGCDFRGRIRKRASRDSARDSTRRALLAVRPRASPERCAVGERRRRARSEVPVDAYGEHERVFGLGVRLVAFGAFFVRGRARK